MAYVKRKSFQTRLDEINTETKEYFDQINEKLLSYKKIKARTSLRCVSYRIGRKLLAKITLGGKTLKLFLSLDRDNEILKQGKYHERYLGDTKAYEEVPLMVLVRSELATRKANQLIEAMMQ